MESIKGAQIAQIALSYPDKDERKYGGSAPNIDCSMFAAEIYAKVGTLLPREATAQAAWFKANGNFTTKFSEVSVGDAAYWEREGGKYHTGIIVQTTPVILVVHATTFDHQPKCIKKNKVQSNGIIQYWKYKFVGVGRLK